MDNWHKLDNAAKLFPAVSKTTNTSIFRISVVLKQDVKPEVLQDALDIVIKRFPSLSLRIRRGVFWYYLEEINSRLMIEEEKDYPCSPIKSSPHNRFLLRVIYYKRRISVEVYHALADAMGAMEFLKTLVYQYLMLQGVYIEPEGLILLPEDKPSQAEMEDSFKKYYRPLGFHITPEKKPFIIEGTPFANFGNNIIQGIVSVKKFRTACKEKGVTITEYISALLAYSIYRETVQYQINPKPINIAIPINLRNIFPSQTLRNFFSVSIISINITRGMDFDDMLEQFKFYLKQKTTEEYLSYAVSRYGKMENMLVSRFIPLFIKDIFIGFGAKNFGEKFKTTTISNLGNIKIPSDMAPHIDWMEMILYPTTIAPINCGVCSVNDRLTISFSRTIIETKIIRHFFNYLATTVGIDVEIYSNDWETEYE
ncbi:MAG: alcohol acetyltransferase [Bacillota bacterium]|jgi:NRPS condensation-like uncharacterized protein